VKQVLGRIITALLVFSMVALGTPLAEAQQPFYPGSQGIVAPVYPFATKTLAAGGNQVWTPWKWNERFYNPSHWHLQRV
jgi:hypothetical protein